jgi:hypothetical protein
VLSAAASCNPLSPVIGSTKDPYATSTSRAQTGIREMDTGNMLYSLKLFLDAKHTHCTMMMIMRRKFVVVVVV